MDKIVQWMRQMLGQKRQPNQVNLPHDWSVIHIPFQQQDLSDTQQRAIIRMSRWVSRPEIQEQLLTEKRERQPIEELTTEERRERAKDLLGGNPPPEMAVHIRREDLPTNEWRSKRTAESIREVIDVFPDNQIQIKTGEIRTDWEKINSNE